MKLTKEKLKQIIKEELGKVMGEFDDPSQDQTAVAGGGKCINIEQAQQFLEDISELGSNDEMDMTWIVHEIDVSETTGLQHDMDKVDLTKALKAIIAAAAEYGLPIEAAKAKAKEMIKHADYDHSMYTCD